MQTRCAPLTKSQRARAASSGELEFAIQLIRHLQSKTWDASRYHDGYRDRIFAWIKKKQGGETIPAPKPSRAPGKVLDLMALKQSLAREKPSLRPDQKKRQAKAKSAKGQRKAIVDLQFNSPAMKPFTIAFSQFL